MKGERVNIQTKEGEVSLVVDSVGGKDVDVHGYKRGVRYEGVIRMTGSGDADEGERREMSARPVAQVSPSGTGNVMMLGV